MSHCNTDHVWLSDVAIFNESENYSVPGDVSIYRNIHEMCAGMEAWMVEGGGIGFALNGLGQQIRLEMDGEDAIGSVVHTSEPDIDTVISWLQHAAKGVQEARIHRSKKKPWFLWSLPVLGDAEEKGVLPETVEGLLAYIHM